MRKGYIYALEGVIAGMLVVFYLGSMIQAPETTSWESTVLTRRAGDLMNVYSRTGLLEESILEDRPSKLATFTSVIGGGVDYRFEINNLPQSEVEVGVVRRGDRYHLVETTGGDFGGYSGVNTEDDYARTGSFGGVDFLLTDTVQDGTRRLNTVYFDFNDNNDVGESGVTEFDLQERPYTVGSMFEGCFNDCSEPELYQVGYINHTLGIYNMEDVRKLVEGKKTSSNGFDISFSYQGVGMSDVIQTDLESDNTVELHGHEITFERSGSLVTPEFSDELYSEGETINLFGQIYTIESVDPLRMVYSTRLNQDVLLLKDEGFSFFENNREVLEDFFVREGAVVELGNYSGIGRETFSDSFHSELGLKKTSPSINRYGPGYNVIRDSERSDAAGFIRSYFYDNPIRIGSERFSQSGEYTRDAVLSVGDKEYSVRYDESRGDEGAVGFSEADDDYRWVFQGDEVLLGYNSYYVDKVFPLELIPREEHRFENMYTGSIQGEETVLEVPRWENNYSAMDRSYPFENAAFDQSFGVTNIDSRDYMGVPDTDCEDSDVYEYRIGDVEMEDSYPFILTDIDCDGSVEYANFDFNPEGNDNYFNESDDRFEQFSGEGIYQLGEMVEIEGTRYRIGFTDTELVLEGEGDRTVGSGYWNQDVYRGHGSLFYTGNITITDSIADLLQTVFMRASVKKHRFTSGGEIGNPNVGTVFSEDIAGTNYLPFTIDTIWWFR